MKKTLTKKEAIAEGYKYCSGGDFQKIKIEDCDFKEDYILLEKEPRPYQISDNLLAELLDEYLLNQDDVYDEDGHLNDVVYLVDFSQITSKVNEALAGSLKFWNESEYMLLPDNPLQEAAIDKPDTPDMPPIPKGDSPRG
jgi:hypothetical protein